MKKLLLSIVLLFSVNALNAKTNSSLLEQKIKAQGELISLLAEETDKLKKEVDIHRRSFNSLPDSIGAKNKYIAELIDLIREAKLIPNKDEELRNLRYKFRPGI